MRAKEESKFSVFLDDGAGMGGGWKKTGVTVSVRLSRDIKGNVRWPPRLLRSPLSM